MLSAAEIKSGVYGWDQSLLLFLLYSPPSTTSHLPPASLSQQSVDAFFSWGWILIRLPSSLRFFGNMCTKNSLGNQKYSSISRYCCAMHLKCKTRTSNEISQHWTQDSKPVGRLVDYNNPAVSWHFCQIHSFAPWCGLNICKANKLHALNHKDTFRGDPAWHHSFCMSLQCQVVFYLNVTCTSTQLFQSLKLHKCWLCLLLRIYFSMSVSLAGCAHLR